MKATILFILFVCLCSCSSHNWFTSDSEAIMLYDRSKGHWEILWTWKLAKGRTKTDTIRVIPEQTNGFIFQEPSEVDMKSNF